MASLSPRDPIRGEQQPVCPRASSVGGCLLPLRKETFHLQWQQLRRKRWMMPRLSKRIRKIVSVLINHAWTVRVLCAQRLRLNSFLHLSTFIHSLWLRELPGVDSPLLSAKASILLKTQFANSRTLKKELFKFFRKKPASSSNDSTRHR